MLEPHGPLPPEIYWRRRVLAAGLALFAVIVVVGVIGVVLLVANTKDNVYDSDDVAVGDVAEFVRDQAAGRPPEHNARPAFFQQRCPRDLRPFGFDRTEGGRERYFHRVSLSSMASPRTRTA